MKRYMHLFETLEERDAEFGSSAYTSPWVSYTKSGDLLDYEKLGFKTKGNSDWLNNIVYHLWPTVNGDFFMRDGKSGWTGYFSYVEEQTILDVEWNIPHEPGEPRISVMSCTSKEGDGTAAFYQAEEESTSEYSTWYTNDETGKLAITKPVDQSGTTSPAVGDKIYIVQKYYQYREPDEHTLLVKFEKPVSFSEPDQEALGIDLNAGEGFAGTFDKFVPDNKAVLKPEDSE